MKSLSPQAKGRMKVMGSNSYPGTDHQLKVRLGLEEDMAVSFRLRVQEGGFLYFLILGDE